jgi:hypothetical protein
MPDEPDLPDWEALLAAERHLQALVPGTVLVGGTAAALHANHRTSHDGDHVPDDLRDRFDRILTELETAAGWTTDRTQRPVLILGTMDGILTGIRQLRRTEPLETEEREGLRVPTLAEMARIKAWLLATRNTTRDYLDLVVLLERLGDRAAAAFARLDALHAPISSTASPMSEVLERLEAATPVDRASVDVASYRGLVSPWNDWSHVVRRGRAWAAVLARAMSGLPMTHDLATSRALWNRNGLDLRSDEVLAQIMDRGSIDDWRALYALAGADSALAGRMVALTSRAAMTMPGFWRAALESLGAAVDHGAPVVRHADVGT